jgi:hypothetical protein
MIMKKLKPVNEFIDHFAPVNIHQEETSKEISTITYNPLQGINTEEYSDSNLEQRDIYIKSKCNEAEAVILTLSKMLGGEIHTMQIKGLNLSVACILKTNKNLTSTECSHILSISRNLKIT